MYEKISAWSKRNLWMIFLWILITIAWGTAFYVGFPAFNILNAILIYSSIIQGMSAILAVAIAVIIFRIQTLENRNQALEQSTLNYIFNITGLTYPQWEIAVEENIETGIITERYYNNRINKEKHYYLQNLKTDLPPNLIERLKNDRDTQQKRLMNNLIQHRETILILEKTKIDFIISTILMTIPIITSLIMLMEPEVLNKLWNFSIISLNVLFSIYGIIGLINVVFESTTLIKINKEDNI